MLKYLRLLTTLLFILGFDAMSQLSIQKNLKNAAIIGVFIVSLFVPFFIGIFEQGSIVSDVEKRKLAKFPQLPTDVDTFIEMPIKIDQYFSDHFGLRQTLTNTYKTLKTKLGDSPTDDVTIGKDGWLFLGSNKVGYNKFGDPIGDFKNKNLYSDEQLKQITHYLNGQYKWLQKQGIAYVFFIAPNKHTIYSDKLPEYITKVNQLSATDQLIQSLRANTNIPVIDLRDRLIQAKAKQLYYKGDTHWNHEAANIAQHQVMQTIESLFKGKINAELFEIIDPKTGFNGDLAQFIGAQNYDSFSPKPNLKNACKVKTKQNNSKGTNYTTICSSQTLKTIIYGDSFFKNFMMQYFSVKFNQATFLWRKPHYKSLNQEIKLHKPDIVVEEWVERHLPYVPRDYDIFERVK